MYRDALRQNRSRELVAEFLDRFLERHGWWAARAGWVTADGMRLDRWRLAAAAPTSLASLAAAAAAPAAPIDAGTARFPEPTLMPVDQVHCTREVAADLAEAGVGELVVVDVAGLADFDVRLVLAAPPGRIEWSTELEALRTGAQLLPTLLRQEVERGELRLGALRDPLTGLLNRAGLDELAGGLPPSTEMRAVIYLDLDGFKAVNDAHGHAAGDALLVDTAQRLARQVRPTDLVARVGGDEFVVVATAVLDEPSVVALAQRLVAALASDTIVDSGAMVSVGASAGIAVWEAGSPFRDVAAAADALMYEAKRIGGGVAVQDATGRILVRDPLGLAAGVEELERGRAPLRLERVVDLNSGRDWAVHVLLRGELCSSPVDETVVLVDAAVSALAPAEHPHRLVIEPRGRGWSREGLLLELLERFRQRFPAAELLLMVDAHPATVELRLIAEEVRARLGVDIVLGGIGASSGGDLRTIAQTAPAVLALDREAVLNLERTRPAGITARLAAALAAAVGATLLVADPPEGLDAARLASWGCTLTVVPHDRPAQLERTA